MTNNWRAFFAMVLISVSPALAVILKDSSSVAGAAYYGITDSAANPFHGIASVSSGGIRIVNPNTSILGAIPFVADSAIVNSKFNLVNLSNFELFGRGLCGSPMLGRQGTSIYGDSRAWQLSS